MNIKEWLKQAKKEDYWCVGKGWSQILITLCDKIITINDTIEVMQVKEKFGGLRFYIGNIHNRFDEIYVLIDKAVEESFKTCESCGTKRNVTTSGGWLRTLCKKCRKEKTC